MHFTCMPNNLYPELLSACRSLSNNKPIYIKIDAPEWAKPNKCPYNSKEYLEKNDGEVIFGWKISHWKNVFVEFIGHAVIKHNDNFIDVTPSTKEDTKILFLQDNNVTFDYSSEMARLPSKNISISKTKEVRRLIKVDEEIDKIMKKYPVSSKGTRISNDDEKIMIKLQDEKQILMPKIISMHTHHNEPCICGSKKKFRKCCQNKF